MSGTELVIGYGEGIDSGFTEDKFGILEEDWGLS